MADIPKKGPSPVRTRHSSVPGGSEYRPDGPERIVTVLAVSPLEGDHTYLRNIFSHSNWSLRDARNWHEARLSLMEHPAAVVICEATLPDSDWKEVLSELNEMSDPPLLIVSSRTADERLWAEVLNLGGYDVLMKPFEAAEIFRVISLAWLSWKNNCAITGRSGRARAVAS